MNLNELFSNVYGYIERQTSIAVVTCNLRRVELLYSKYVLFIRGLKDFNPTFEQVRMFHIFYYWSSRCRFVARQLESSDTLQSRTRFLLEI